MLDRSGRIWVGTEGSGLCLYDVQNDCFKSVHKEFNLPGDMVGSMQEDNSGNLWLGTNQGLAKLTISGKERAGYVSLQLPMGWRIISLIKMLLSIVMVPSIWMQQGNCDFQLGSGGRETC